MLAVLAFMLGWADGMWSFAEVAPQGLLPDNRAIVDGHYYVWSKNHGRYIEVSQYTWEWLPAHQTRVFLVTTPLAIVGAAYLVVTYRQRFGRGDVRPGWKVFASEDETTSNDALIRATFSGRWGIPAGIAIVVGLALGAEWLVSPDRSPWMGATAGAFLVFGAVLAVAIISSGARRKD